MWAALIAGVVHQCPTLAGAIRLLEENKAVREVSGFAKDKLPTNDALGRFPRKLVRPEKEVEGCFEGLVERLRQLFLDLGKN